MRITVDKNDLARAATLAKTALQAKSPTSHLSVLESDGKAAKLWGTDGVCYVEVALPATFEGEGSISAPVESAILASMASNGSEKVILQATDRHLKLLGGPKTSLSLYEYAQKPDPWRSEMAYFPVNSELISTAIQAGSVIPPKDSGRYAYNGFGFRTVGSNLLVEATDGRRFYQAKIPTGGTPAPAVCVAPAAAMNVLGQISDFVDCKVGMSANALQFETGPLKFRTLLLAGSWPSDGIDSIFAALPREGVSCLADSFFAKLANLKAAGFEDIFIEFLDGNLRFYSQSQAGDSEWLVPATSGCKERFQAKFSVDYLLDAKRLKMRNMEILFSGPDNPYIFREAGSTSAFYGLMGMELQT